MSAPSPGPWRTRAIHGDPAGDKVDVVDRDGRTVAMCLTHADVAAILAGRPWLLVVAVSPGGSPAAPEPGGAAM